MIQWPEGITTEIFLDQYWQQKPLLIRQALPSFHTILSPDELAGLACEDGINSRLIIEKDAASPWHLEQGPFEIQRFSQLPETHWTLLVQDVDQWIEDIHELKKNFRFIPDWRIDDVMISYAPEHGSVGPHTDQYDVFLLQAMGQRHWHISETDVEKLERIEGIDLDIFKEFLPEHDWVLNPGDMLYLPPNIAHHGIALNDCMTYSIGFRAPSYKDLVTAFIDDVISHLPETDRYSDPHLNNQQRAYTISNTALEQLADIVQLKFMNKLHIYEWLGRYLSQPKQENIIPNEITSKITDIFNETTDLIRSSYGKWYVIDNDVIQKLFVNGASYPLPPDSEFIEWLCDNDIYVFREYSKYQVSYLDDLIVTLFNDGHLLSEPFSNSYNEPADDS